MRIFRPLRSVPIALLWGGLSLSALGDQLYAVALTWIAVSALGPNAGYLTALQALVALIAVLCIGGWADRWDQQRSMVGADLTRAGVLLAVVAAWMISGGPTAAGLVVAVVVLAIGQAVFQPALQTVLPSLIDDIALLPAANGLLDATDRSARLLGPGLVALLASILPVVHFLTLDAVSFAASAVALLLITRLHVRARPMPRRPREAVWQGTTRGIQAMNSHPLLGYSLLTGGLLNGAWYAVFYLSLPLLIEQRHIQGPGGSGLGAFGLVISAYGCTNLATTIFCGGRPLSVRPQLQMFGGNLIVGGGMVLLGLVTILPPTWLLPGLMMAASVGAIGGPMKDIPLAVLRQTRLRHVDMAAAMRAYIAVGSAGTLLAMLATPACIHLAGIVPVIVVCGSVIASIGLVGLVRYRAWVEASQFGAVEA